MISPHTNHRDFPRPAVCVCEAPRLTGGCVTCPRPAEGHMPNECRACHRPVLTIDSEDE